MSTPKAEYKISADSAREQINSWLDYYGLDFADIVIEDGKEAAETLMNTLVRAIQRGELEISIEGDLEIIQHLRFPVEGVGDKITYLDKTGNAKIAMGKEKNDQIRMLCFMGALCGIEAKHLKKMKGSDATIRTRLATVFSMV
jgi:hypothetical protein